MSLSLLIRGAEVRDWLTAKKIITKKHFSVFNQMMIQLLYNGNVPMNKHNFFHLILKIVIF